MSAPKILLVDDTKLFLELEKNFLKLSPVHVLTASSGEEALEVARTEHPDLIFMDITMPGMGGIACCATLKADTLLNTIPVIMVSSCGKEEDLEACKRAGCNDFLTKPIDRKLFLDKARSFLDSIDRRDVRVTCEAPVTFTVDGVSRSGVSFDLSNGGIYVSETRPVEEKSVVSLKLTLPDASATSITAQGIVAWENGPGKRRKMTLPPGFGVEFTAIAEADNKAIKSYVERARLKGYQSR
jgi:CheY-like chemotaxis protein